MFNLVGYLLNQSGGPPLDHGGIAYNYILAGNGLFVQADNAHITARVTVVAAEVRGGPPPMYPLLTLKHGRIPQRLFDLALSVMLASPDKERYVGIRWSDGYQLYVPEQEGAGASVTYQTADDVVVELHSHPDMPARFSGIDNKDEQGFKVYGVIGRELVDATSLGSSHREFALGGTCINLRVGVYGYYMPVKWSDIFDGKLDAVDENDREKEIEEP